MRKHDYRTVESEALKLEPQARAKLAEKLPRSLDELSDEDIEQLWAEEAVRRDAEIDSGQASVRAAEDVFRDARARLS
jgi:putative addiction module component